MAGMAEFYETTDDRDFDAEDFDTLTIGRRINSGGIEFATRDMGNSSSAVIPISDIWNVIDHLVGLAGPRAVAAWVRPPGCVCGGPSDPYHSWCSACAAQSAGRIGP